MQMTLKKIVPTNKIVDVVYDKHIANEQKALLNKPKQTSYIVSEDQVHLIRCLSLFMRVSAISRLIGISDQYVSKIKRYEIYRSVVCSFQNTPYKRLGKIYFEIDFDKLQEYISSLPNEYKDICNLGKLNLDGLVYKSKIRSGE